MDSLIKILGYVLDYVNGVPAQSWYALGVLLASIPAVIGIVAYVKRRHLRKYAEKLASEFIVLNVAFWSALLTVANFVITQGTNFAPFLPFMSTHWAQISAGAIAVHAVATALKKHFQEKKAQKKTDFLSGLPNLSPQIQAIQQPITSSQSFGSASAGVDKSKLLQL